MNEARRKKIRTIINEVEEVRGKMAELVERAIKIGDAIQGVIDEETEFLDNMSEKSRDGDKGEEIQGKIYSMDGAMSGILAMEDIDFDAITDALTNAIE